MKPFTCRLRMPLKALLQTAVLTAIMALFPRQSSAFVFVRDGFPTCYVVLGPNASGADQYAARLITGSVYAMTGAELPVKTLSAGELPATGGAVLIGKGDWFGCEEFAETARDISLVGDEGIVVRETELGRRTVLLVAGESDRATVYAAVELLRLLGVRWYAPDVTKYPESSTLEIRGMDLVDLPCFDIRQAGPQPGLPPEWLALQRLNVGTAEFERSIGCPPAREIVRLGIESLLPTESFESAPELFPLVNGTRTATAAGRCFGGTRAAEVAADSIRACLDRTPGTYAVIIDPGETAGGCTCARCSRIAIDQQSESGLVLSWVNRVARICADNGLDVLVILDARRSFSDPPAILEPAENVAILLEPELTDQRRRYDEAVDDAALAFMTRFHGWRALTNRIIVRHRAGNTTVPAAPFPDFRQIFANMDLYHGEFVEGLMMGGEGLPGMFSADSELRTWVLGQLMWDRYQDGETLVREWMKGIYGNAWGPMFDYWRHVQSLAGNAGGPLISSADPLSYITGGWISTGTRMFQRAYAQSMTDSTAHRRIFRERLGFKYLHFLAVERDIADGKRTVPDQRALFSDLDTWIRECNEYGLERMRPEETVGEFADRVRGMLMSNGR